MRVKYWMDLILINNWAAERTPIEAGQNLLGFYAISYLKVLMTDVLAGFRLDSDYRLEIYGCRKFNF